MQTLTRKIQEGIWLASAIGIPLLVYPWGCSAFEIPKTSLLLALGLLAIWTVIVEIIQGPRPTPQAYRSLLVWSALGIGLVAILTTLTSVNPGLSLWGSFERQQGLITQLAYLVLFWLVAARLRTWKQAERIIRALTWTSAPVVVYGLLQAAGLDLYYWHSDAASPTLSTVGRANFLGSYLVLLLPLTARHLLHSRRRWPYVLLLTGQVLCLLLTQARGAWAGAIAAALVWITVEARRAGRRQWIGAMWGAVLVCTILVVVLNLSNGPLERLAHLPGIERLATLSDTSAGSTAARLTVWRTVLPLISDRTWLGYGPETMTPLFLRVYPPELVYYQGRQVAVDRAHNLWLDLGQSQGILGILSFLVLLASFGWTIWRNAHKATNIQSRGLWTAILASIVGHLVDLQFSFTVTTSATVFWLLLGLTVAIDRGIDEDPKRECSPASLCRGERASNAKDLKPTAWLPVVPPLLVTLALIFWLCGRPLLADGACWQSRRDTHTLEARRSAAERAVRWQSKEPLYRVDLAWRCLDKDLACLQLQMATAHVLSPDNAQLWAIEGDLHALSAERDPLQYIRAERAYRRALELAPNIAVYHSRLGTVLAQMGQIEQGIEKLERAVDLDATDYIAYGHLSDLYRALGDKEKAKWAAEQSATWQAQTSP